MPDPRALLLLVVATPLMLGCQGDGAARAPAALGPGTPRSTAGYHTQASWNGGYVVHWRSAPAELPVGEPFALEAWVADARAPEVLLAGVELEVDAAMPQHGHGMTRRALVTRASDGSWRAEGLLFHMPGEWRLYFDVRNGPLLERAEARVVLD